jgi:hypothetical protein
MLGEDVVLRRMSLTELWTAIGGAWSSPVTYHQPEEWEQTAFFEPPDWYHRPPDSGELQYKSRGLEKAI